MTLAEQMKQKADKIQIAKDEKSEENLQNILIEINNRAEAGNYSYHCTLDSYQVNKLRDAGFTVESGTGWDIKWDGKRTLTSR